MRGVARYDGIAEWYDRELADSELGRSARAVVLRLLGDGPGRLLDVGCGGGSHAAAVAERGWDVTGVDVSEDQLRLARGRGVEVVRTDAAELPFGDASFDAAISIFTHTDVDDFAAILREAARVLRAGAPLVYLGVHPCFVGPHSRFVATEGVPALHPGYRDAGRYDEAPGITPGGLRVKVGAVHLPLGPFVQAFLDAGFALERFEEPGTRPYPGIVALRCRRGER
jgi:SAM-dependent methyltransferase